MSTRRLQITASLFLCGLHLSQNKWPLKVWPLFLPTLTVYVGNQRLCRNLCIQFYFGEWYVVAMPLFSLNIETYLRHSQTSLKFTKILSDSFDPFQNPSKIVKGSSKILLNFFNTLDLCKASLICFQIQDWWRKLRALNNVSCWRIFKIGLDLFKILSDC